MKIFLQARLEKFQSVGCVSWVDSTEFAPKLVKKFSPPPDTSKVLEKSLNVSACDASIRNPAEFVPGSVHFCHEFWEKKILVSCPNKLEMLSWIRDGVKIEPYLNTHTNEVFNGKRVYGHYPPPYAQQNRVPAEFFPWVRSEISKWERNGVIVRQSESLRASVILPLTIEPKKPRLIHDAQYLNLFLKDVPFSMDGVGKIPQAGWLGMFMFSVDHKSGYHHVGLHHSAWEYFGLEWEGVIYMATTLTFGCKLSPYIYHSLTEASLSYVRSLTLAPSLAWLDDIWGGNSAISRKLSSLAQWQSANRVLYILLQVLYSAGYFLSLDKSVLRPTYVIRFLGIMTDSRRGRFWVPADKVENLVSLISQILSVGHAKFEELEKCVGKCRSMAVAVPCAILYTREQYAALSKLSKQGRGSSIRVVGSLQDELLMWLQLGDSKSLVNGSAWFSSEHFMVEAGTGFTDASGRRWGGFIRSIEGKFEAAADFEDHMLSYHIGQKEAVGLCNVLKGFVRSTTLTLKGKLFIINIDNQGLFEILAKGGSSMDTITTDICKELFWIQVFQESHFKFQCT